jgi:CheY-like chemotaxis protein
LNLGLNARDAMPEGGHLTYRTRQVVHSNGGLLPHGAPADLPPGNWVHLSVQDTGTGMDDEVKAHLFEPFFTTKPPGKGTGLGLASVYGTLQLLEGRIVVDSATGQGTTFHLWIPLSDKEAQVEDEIDPNDVRRQAGHILLVDDDEAVRTVGRKLLVGLGCKVSTAVDGLEALDFYQEHKREIDLVVLDMQMPNLDGQGTFRELRRLDPKVRVLLVSGQAGREEAERCLAEGALDVLAKPFKLEDLSRAIARYGRLRRSPTLPPT